MVVLDAGSPEVVIIGDIVDSRSSPDRAALHAAVVRALADADAAHLARAPMRVTVGDEFQGVFPTLGAALATAFRVRALLLPHIDVRIGVGRGPITMLDPRAGVSDGPGWWAAREALEQVEASARTPARQARRMAYLSAGEDQRLAAVNAALQCQDLVMGLMSSSAHEVLKGLVMMPGVTQQTVAATIGVSPSALSQQVVRHGLRVLLDAVEDLGRLP